MEDASIIMLEKSLGDGTLYVCMCARTEWLRKECLCECVCVNKKLFLSIQHRNTDR